MRLRNLALLIFALFTVLAVATLPAMSQGCTPIPFTRPITYPIQITAPGCYVLTRDLATSSLHTFAVIQILSHNVSIDLNGFNLYAAGPLAAGSIISDGFSNIEIRNGTVSGGLSSIHITNGDDVIIENVRVTPLISGGYAGIRLQNIDNFRIRDNLIWGSATFGIAAEGTVSPLRSGTIEGNQIQDTQSGIVVGAGAGIVVKENRIDTSPGLSYIGIGMSEVTGCSVTGNTVVAPLFEGINLYQTSNCDLRGNIVQEAGTIGISLNETSHDNMLVGNQVTGSVGSGIFIDSQRNHIQQNLSNSNGAYGLEFGTSAASNIYRGNTATGNTGPAASCNPSATDDFCDRDPATDTSHGDNYIPTQR